MNAHTVVPLAPTTRHIRTEIDIGSNVLWAWMHASEQQRARPCCSLPIIEDGLAIQQYVERLAALSRENDAAPALTHLVLGSAANVYSLGGDLELFQRCIRTRDRDALRHYALRCVEAVHGFQDLAGSSVHTVALVQGDALGGGFEVALSCNTLVAEEGALLGFPEVLFGLFPGMGAYSFLRRRLPPHAAQRLMLDGNLHTAEKLHDLGVVDVLAPRGGGLDAVRDLIRQRRRGGRAHEIVGRIHARASKVPLEELRRITLEWVDAAMSLNDRALQTMERIVRAQQRRFGNEAASGAASAQ